MKKVISDEASKLWLEAEVARLNSILKSQGLSQAKRYDICGEFFFGLSVFLDQGEFSVGNRRCFISLRADSRSSAGHTFDLHDYSEAIVSRIVEDGDFSSLRAAKFTPLPIPPSELGTSKLWALRIEFSEGRMIAFTVILDLTKTDDILRNELSPDLKKLGDQKDRPELIARMFFTSPGKSRRKIVRTAQSRMALTCDGILKLFRDEAKRG